MQFEPNQNHSISLEEASKMTKKYREMKAATDPIASAFGKTAINDILNQENCAGIRAYYARDDKSQLTLVIAGVDTNGDDLYDGKLAEWSALCPPICGASNPLNS